MMSQNLESIPSMWEMLMAFWAPGCGLAQPWLCGYLGSEPMDGGFLCVFPSVCVTLPKINK